MAELYRHDELGLQHAVSHSRLQLDGEARLLCRWRKRNVRALLHSHSNLPARAEEVPYQTDVPSNVDRYLRCALPSACPISHILVVGLHVQHGGQCSRRCGSQCTVELVQYHKLSEAEKAVGRLAWADCCMDHPRYELGASGFPTTGRND